MQPSRYIRPAIAGLAGALVLMSGPPVALARQSSGIATSQARGFTTVIMSPVVVANWLTERQPDGREALELLVLWRGSVGWFLGAGGSGASGGGPAGHPHVTITYSGLRFTLDFDSRKRIATVQGKTLDLAGDNVGSSTTSIHRTVRV
jgi:hypothetical protein